MKKIVAIYTGQGLAEPLSKLFKEEIPDVRFVNLMDDSIIHDVIKAKEITKDVSARLINYFQIAQSMNPDIILSTCSSVGDVVNIARNIIKTPIVKIDEAMAVEVATNYKNIGVLATLPTTLDPTIRLIESKAQELGKDINIVNGLADGAYLALIGGNPEEHDAKILEAAKKAADTADCFVLAQGSMGRMQKKLEEITGKTVLASPPICVKYVKELLGGIYEA